MPLSLPLLPPSVTPANCANSALVGEDPGVAAPSVGGGFICKKNLFCVSIIVNILINFMDLTLFKQDTSKTANWLSSELSLVRTGRASISVLDLIKVEAYGSLMPINQVANIGVEDPKTIRISPYDQSLSKDIEKSIISSNLGLSVNADDKGLRLVFPELTTERRQSLLKLAKQKLEDAKASVRVEREKTLKEIERKQKDGEISEDQKFKFKADVQKIVDESSKILDEIFAKKEKEIES